MRRFLYYFPKLAGLNAKMMAERGVLDRFCDGGGDLIEHGISGVNEGPQGQPTGCILSPGPIPPDYAPARQRWFEGINFWVGIESLPPRPADVQRGPGQGIEGHELVMGDGNGWRIPLVRKWDKHSLQHFPNLPTAMVPKVNAARGYGFAREIVPEFQHLDAMADRTFKAFYIESQVNLSSVFADVAALLAVNYRMGIEEMGLLGLLTEENAVRALQLSIDADAIRSQSAELAVEGVSFAEPVIVPEE